MGWTPDQENCITARGGTVLVSAAAGSGKTTVLVERVKRRLLDAEAGVDVEAGAALVFIFLQLIFGGIELLIFFIGADNAADEGEHEHRDQNDHTENGNAVTEESLGDHSAGGQDLNAAVVVQGVLLLAGGTLLLGIQILFFRHGSASFH